MRIIRGLAINNFGTSYLDRFQQIAEEESSLKVKRLERDIPKYLRAQDEWMNDVKSMTQGAEQEGFEEEERSYVRGSIEDILQDAARPYGNKDPVKNYQPVLYEVVKGKDVAQERESLSGIHESFVERTERLLQIFHQRSHVHDGLKNLSDNEIILKVREAPTKLKSVSQTFLRKLRSHGVRLSESGEVDYSQVKDENVKKTL